MVDRVKKRCAQGVKGVDKHCTIYSIRHAKRTPWKYTALKELHVDF